jgi:hypothetical protein
VNLGVRWRSGGIACFRGVREVIGEVNRGFALPTRALSVDEDVAAVFGVVSLSNRDLHVLA